MRNVNRDNIPWEMQETSHWVLWTQVGAHKRPLTPSGVCARVNDPRTWSDFETVWEAYQRRSTVSGIGFVFTPESGFYGIDIDSCRDPHSGIIDAWGECLLDQIVSYAEVSPSKTGVKLFLKGNEGLKNFKLLIAGVKSHGGKRPAIEVFYRGFFTVTGWKLPGSSSYSWEPNYPVNFEEIGL